MKASAAGYVRATELSHALRLLSDMAGDAQVIAGGQSLVASMNLRLSGEINLIDINGIESLKGILETEAGLRIGALTRHNDLARDPLVAAQAPALAQAAPLIAHAAIRTRGTIGGSLAYADPAAELPACVLALKATIIVEGKDGERRIAAEDFFEGLFSTALEEGEIITAVEIPRVADDARQIVLELARRSGDYALAGIVFVSGPDPRIVYFGMGDTPVLAQGAMAALRDDGVAAAVAALDGDLDPPGDIHGSAAYRKQLARVLLRRAVAQAERETENA